MTKEELLEIQKLLAQASFDLQMNISRLEKDELCLLSLLIDVRSRLLEIVCKK